MLSGGPVIITFKTLKVVPLAKISGVHLKVVLGDAKYWGHSPQA